MNDRKEQSTKAEFWNSPVSTIFFLAAYGEIDFSCSREVRGPGRLP